VKKSDEKGVVKRGTRTHPGSHRGRGLDVLHPDHAPPPGNHRWAGVVKRGTRTHPGSHRVYAPYSCTLSLGRGGAQ
jgi:hypothetical protein